MMDPARRRPGFLVPGVAASAAAKNHRLGTAHQFTSASAAAAGRKSAEKRRIERLTLATEATDGRA